MLTTAAILFAVAGVVVLTDVVSPARGLLYLALIVLLDVAVFVTFGAIKLQRLVIQPMASVVAAAEEIARGDLNRRVPSSGPLELHQVADSVNRMTDRLLDERAQLVRAEKLASVGRLAAGIAHEVGNPLGAVTGYAHLLRAHANGTQAALDAVTGLERETARIDRIVRGLLDYARQRTPLHAPVDVNETIQSSLELLVAQGALRDVSISLNLDPTEPRVLGDRHELQQMFVNLLLNAVDTLNDTKNRPPRPSVLAIYTERVDRELLAQPSARRTPPNGLPVITHRPPSRAESWALRHRGETVVRVVLADSGPGVAPDDAERIFDPFFTTKEPGKGTGLGLAIVSRIVDNLHGTVWVAPAREGGAAFHILFPAAS